MLVQFDPTSAEIDIATHRYTFLDVFLCVEITVELICDVRNDFRTMHIDITYIKLCLTH